VKLEKRKWKNARHQLGVFISGEEVGLYWNTGPVEGSRQPMVINIKSDETQKLLDELAELTGETAAVALTAALRERLDRDGASEGVNSRYV
jgi:hypothetical protein